jgi:hypothetical protein
LSFVSKFAEFDVLFGKAPQDLPNVRSSPASPARDLPSGFGVELAVENALEEVSHARPHQLDSGIDACGGGAGS